MPDLDAKPALAPGYRFQWEPVQSCHVLLYPEGMVQLNETAAAILSFCDGQRNVLRVIADLENEYAAEGLREDVLSFLAEAVERGWVRYA
ncbi:MAG: pyrroloquinoline quinone biosynthesis peptide chaperone PqqD [Candidatus Thiothrix moscowensis]|nr:pyrroloquinoline quinone biosynthesis peptide chaperone PqqD [Candidatus Thiothrix moscowensis]